VVNKAVNWELKECTDLLVIYNTSTMGKYVWKVSFKSKGVIQFKWIYPFHYFYRTTRIGDALDGSSIAPEASM
jgi:hypothetical protein